VIGLALEIGGATITVREVCRADAIGTVGVVVALFVAGAGGGALGGLLVLPAIAHHGGVEAAIIGLGLLIASAVIRDAAFFDDAARGCVAGDRSAAALAGGGVLADQRVLCVQAAVFGDFAALALGAADLVAAVITLALLVALAVEPVEVFLDGGRCGGTGRAHDRGARRNRDAGGFAATDTHDDCERAQPERLNFAFRTHKPLLP
jgi:hypothetical protein